jgi:3-oxo-5-alpha-steroid 4-dehydrogenase 1
MSEQEIFQLLLIFEFAASPFVALSLLFISAPYGRYTNHKWGPALNVKISWFIMEAFAIVSFDAAYFFGEHAANPVPLIFFTLWHIHYLYRAIIYPWRLPASNKQMPVILMIFGIFFNVINGYLNGRYLSAFGSAYNLEWLISLSFIIGTFLFISGFMINFYADGVLLNLRKPGEAGYKIPNGFLYEYISCPNYLGEVIEWFGWSIATWSLPGLAFAVFTAANLVPRAYTHHQWYQNKFPSYPEDRKAILPFIL